MPKTSLNSNDPFDGGQFESPVTYGSRGNSFQSQDKGKGSPTDGGQPSQYPGQFQMRFKLDEQHNQEKGQRFNDGSQG